MTVRPAPSPANNSPSAVLSNRQLEDREEGSDLDSEELDKIMRAMNLGTGQLTDNDDDDEKSMQMHDGDEESNTENDESESSELSRDAGAEGAEEEDIKGPPPEHACTYCGWHDTEHVVKCVPCGKWFCNGRTPGTPASHIVHHLVRAKHKEVLLHPLSSSGESNVECYHCGNRNIFTLGFVPAKEESVVILLCRAPCANESGKDGEWDPTGWMPLIEDKQLLEWFVGVPSAEQMRSVGVGINAKDLLRLEEAWQKGDPNCRLNDLAKLDALDAQLQPLPTRFEDTFQYGSLFVPLIDLEAEYDHKMKESQTLTNVTIRWERSGGVNKRIIAWFVFSSASYADLKPAAGDEVAITLGKWRGLGSIIEIGSIGAEEIAVELSPMSAHSAPLESTVGFQVDFVWKSTPFDRMKLALRKFAGSTGHGAGKNADLDPLLVNALLGNLPEEAIPTLKVKKLKSTADGLIVPGLCRPNASQAEAIERSLTRPISLIQGPPGTGKTVTSAMIVWHLVNTGGYTQVLVVAPSNVAADHLTEKIHQTGLRVLRIAAKCRESALDVGPVDFLTLHQQIRHYTVRPQLQKLLQLKAETGYLSNADQAKLVALRRRAERGLLAAAQVVVATCVGAGDPRLQDRRFSAVLLDEAAQACEPEALIPLLKGAKHVVLVGDHRQLGPVILEKRAAKANLTRSLFERLISVGLKPIRLQTQYRMHPCLSEWPSNAFYEGTLQNGISHLERSRPNLDFPWYDPSKPMMFVHCPGSEELSSSGTSFLNRMEATHVEKIITRFLRAAVLPSQIGVITPYDGQRVYIQQAMQTSGVLRKELYCGIEVASVDAFQGREKDYIILSCVRSNDHQGIGFLSDPRRLNVALTRAKYGLIVLGNARVLARNALWNKLLLHFKINDLLLEGPLGALKQSMVPLPVPRMSDAPLFVQNIVPAPALEGTMKALTFGTITPESIFVMNEFFERNRFKGASSSAVLGTDTDEVETQATFDTQL